MAKLPRVSLIALCLALSLAGISAAQPARLGAEFQINTRTTGVQAYAEVARDDAGNFVVVWVDEPAEFSMAGDVFARRFNAAGVPLAAPFLVNSYTTGNQYRPAVASAGAGQFVVIWQSYAQDGASAGVFARRFSATGTPLATELQVNTRTIQSQLRPDVGAADNGDFVVVWMSLYQDGGGFSGLFGQRFQSGGTRVGVEFAVNAFTLGEQAQPVVAVDDDGDFVVAWTADGTEIVARTFNSSGVGASEVAVNVYGTDDQTDPAVAIDSDGDFVVTWESNLQDGSADGIFARRFNAIGAPLSGDIPVNSFTPNEQRRPTVAMDDSGDFVITWQSAMQEGTSTGVFAQHFDSTGARRGDEVRVNSYLDGAQDFPDVDMAPGGDFVVVWSSDGQDGSAKGVFGQRYSAPKILDIDGNGDFGPLTDALLVLRYAFGFRGTTLTGGAIGAGCTRCDAAAIEPYLAGLV